MLVNFILFLHRVLIPMSGWKSLDSWLACLHPSLPSSPARTGLSGTPFWEGASWSYSRRGRREGGREGGREGREGGEGVREREGRE